MTQTPNIFDTGLLARRILRPREDWITKMVMDDLVDRLAFVTRDISRAALVAPDASALLSSAASANGPFAFERYSTLASTADENRIDPASPRLPSNDYQLIVSILDLQIVNDVPSYLEAMRRHLQPDGLFLAALVGGRSLTELRDAWLKADVELSGGVVPRVAPMIDVRDAGMLLQRAGFGLPVADIESHTVRYDNPLALMHEIKALGASNPLIDHHPGMTSPRRLLRAAEIYAENFSDPDGRIRATLEILWLSGWAPHESQQKPLKPGSAQKSLRDVLGDKGEL